MQQIASVSSRGVVHFVNSIKYVPDPTVIATSISSQVITPPGLLTNGPMIVFFVDGI